MAVLTESMTRVRDEIQVLRRNRESLRNQLAESTEANRKNVFAWLSALARDRAGASRAWCGPGLAGRARKKS